MDELDDAVSFHGHLCPMFYLGFRMGEDALKLLNRVREKGVKFHAVVEFANCFGDGIQYVTGATFGKNNLHLNDQGKFAASFYDLVTGNTVRLKMKEDVVKKVLEYGKAGKKIKRLRAGEREAETRMLMVSGREMVEWLKKLSDEELFEITAAPVFTPEEGPSLDYIICQECRELTLEELVEKDGKVILCKTCHGSK
jgi:formylmethanofuran dehydrogenase subunit E